MALSYTITYTNSDDGTICGYTNIPAIFCIDRICNHTFQVSTFSCPHRSKINITVFGSNQLGNGSYSNPVTVGQYTCIAIYHK